MQLNNKIDKTQMLDKTFITFDRNIFEYLLGRGIDSVLNGKTHDGDYFALYHRTEENDEVINEYIDIVEGRDVICSSSELRNMKGQQIYYLKRR